MHTVTQYAPLAIMLAIGYAADYWNKRPTARARWAALSLHGKIARYIRIARLGVAFQAGWLVLFAGLRMSGLLSFNGWLSGTIAAGIVLAVDLYLLRNALAARRAYDRLGPFAYLAEVQHAFGGTVPASTPNYGQPGLPGYRHFPSCECGHCPVAGSDQSEVTS